MRPRTASVIFGNHHRARGVCCLTTPAVEVLVNPLAAAHPALRLSIPAAAAPAFSPRAVHLDDAITAENRHVEVTLRWKGTVRSVVRLRDATSLSIGTGASDALCVPLPAVRSFTVLSKATDGSWLVRLGPGMPATLRQGDDVVDIDDAHTLFDHGARAVPLQDGVIVDMVVGDHRLEIRAVARSRRVVVAPFFDALWANAALLSSFAMTALIAATLFFPASMDDLDDDLFTNPSRFSSVILKPPPKDNSFLARLPTPTPKAPSSSGSASAAGQKQPTPTSGRMASKAETTSDAEVVQGRLNALFGERGVGAVFGGDTDGGALQAALGGLDGRQVAAAHGLGGLGLRVMGTGHAGVGTGTLGSGRIGTRGRGGNDDGYGEGTGGLIGKEDREPTVVFDKGTVTGTLDPELIRQVVRSHAGQIRYCYERELTTTPGLGGKIVMKWVIAPNGTVMSAGAVDNQMKSAAVADCLASRVKGWTFPLPRGGGVVVVSYPFVFKQAG